MAAPAPAPRPAAPTPASAPAAPSRAPGAGAAARSNGPAGEAAPGVLELKGMSEFKPPAPIADFLDARKTSTVNVRFGNLARGPITVATASKGKYRFKRQAVPLTHAVFARAAEVVPDLAPSLIFNLEGDKLDGHVGLAAGEKVAELKPYLAKAPEMLGLVGFTISSLPGIINTIEGGSLRLGLTNVPIRLGSAFSGAFSLEAKDEAVTFSGNATINVRGLVNGTLDMKRAPDGAITGKASVGLSLPKNISGSVDVAWDGQAITGEGKVGYKGEKLSGEVTLRLMEKSQAEQLEAANKAPEGATAPQAAGPKGKGKSANVEYVVFGEGDLSFAFTDWLNGSARVIINPKGYLTVIGKITPQKEFILFKQRDYDRQLFKVEARASYGIPVVGNIFIFANVSMSAFATLGPAKFYNIVVEGTYSTDPKKANNFSIRGSLNISAAAGLRLRGEAGVGLEILAHDIKAGAGINGIAGIKGYAEATPIIGYREKAAEGQDKKGEFFIRGELEIAAQPFLGLSGDVFVEIDAPWWSPVPDKRWTWPLGGKEWPIGGSLGVGASVDYVFGSNEWPKLDFKPVEFDSSKFMSDLYADKAKSGSGKEVEKPGNWGEKNSKAADPPPAKPPAGNAKPGKGAPPPPAKPKVQPGGGNKSTKPADPNAKTKEGKSVKQLQDEAAKKGKKPPGGDVSKSGKDEPAKKEATKAAHDEELKQGLAALEAVTARYAKDGASKEDLIGGIKAVRRKFKVFKSIDVVEDGEYWAYKYVASDGTLRAARRKKAERTVPTKITYSSPDARRGGKGMVAHPVGPDHPTGSRPSEAGAPPIWPEVNQRRNGRRLYVLGHLLNQQLGGPGDTVKNLTPITFSANARHQSAAEKDVKRVVNNEKKMVHYEVWVNYPSAALSAPEGVNPAEGELATSIGFAWWELKRREENSDELLKEGSEHREGSPVANVPPFPQT